MKLTAIREKRSVPYSALGKEEGGNELAVDAARFKPNGMWGIPPRRWEDDTPDRLAMNRQAISQLQEGRGIFVGHA